jgi:phage tail sheath protein FI
MPATLSYPGVYIEEIPSGVHTIAGVATSVAAFIGWAPKGNTTAATRVLSWSDFERNFGGLDSRSLLGYSVYAFFVNGGQDAYVVRLSAEGDVVGHVTIDPLAFKARNAGDWSSTYGITIKHRADDATRFRVAVVSIDKDGNKTEVEGFENLSMAAGDPRNAVSVINARSSLVTVSASGTSVPAEKDGEKLTDGAVGTPLTPSTDAFHTALTAAIPQLERVDLFNLLCVPGETNATQLTNLQAFCQQHRAFLIADSPEDATLDTADDNLGTLGGDAGKNAAFYFPWLNAPDAAQEGRARAFPPCGFVAGVYARTDTNRGVWKAPAGTEASLVGVSGVTIALTDKENGVLNIQGVNCIRSFPTYGTVVWGARTLHGSNDRGSEWKYIPVRRTALFIEESLYRSTQWVVFEPNDEPLWAQIRLNVGAFMNGLFRQGAFQGTTPREAYFVKCDKDTNPQNDIDRGIVNIIVGFAPLKPAEFVIIKLQQIAGQIQT